MRSTLTSFAGSILVDPLPTAFTEKYAAPPKTNSKPITQTQRFDVL